MKCRSAAILGFEGAILSVLLGCGSIDSEALQGAGGVSVGVDDRQGDEGADVAIDAIHDPTWDLNQAIVAASNATACTSGMQCPTGYCVDGFCCDNRCDNKCMACSAAKKGSGVDGVCGSIKYDTDPDNDCPYGACDGKNMCKNYNSVACTSAAQCLSNYCVDGFCCNNICMGSCQACSAAKKGSGQDGVCGSIKAATDPDNECNPGECNGSGACSSSPQPTNVNGAACTSSAQCASGFCADGVCCDSWCLGTCQACTASKKGSGTDGTCGPIANDRDPDEECWGGACNGAGVCKQYNGVPCTDKTQCLSNFCVDGFCCGNICTGSCYACSEARKGGGYDGACGPILSGRDPDNECNPGECNGSGTCNQAQTLQANGTACASAGQCASGKCVDGFCCDSACTGACQACSAAKKGSGANGTCGNIVAETDPDNECGYGGRCGGNGTCKFYNGLPCTSTAQCFSNFCADGVCCGNICNQTCYACTAAKKGQGVDGACGAIANAQDPDNECAAGSCNGAGACTGVATDGLPAGSACVAGSECASRICNNLVCETSKPANGPLMWMTLRDGRFIADLDFLGDGTLDLYGISSGLDVGREIRVAGQVSKLEPFQTRYTMRSPLAGHFNAAGETQVSFIPWSYQPQYGGLKHYRGGMEVRVEKWGNCTCRNHWAGGPSNTWAMPFAAAGKNDAGQYGVMLQLSACGSGCLHYTFDVGDGEEMHEPVLVRYSPAGAIELKIPVPSLLTDPIMLGPAGEFHSLDATNHRVVKYTATGALVWNLPFTGTLASSAFDVDATGNVLIGFSFTGSVDFGAGPLTASGTDLGLVKLNPSGGVVWQKRFAGGVENVKLVRAGTGDFAILARRTAAMDLGTGAITGNTVLAKFDSSGNALWHANFNNLGNLAVSADKAGSVYLGTSSLTADFGWDTPMSNWVVGIAMAKYGTCTGTSGCKARNASCSANTECSSGSCVSGACF